MKKYSLILVIVLLLGIFVLPTRAYTIGDVDNDGSVSAMDARLALRMSVDLEPYEAGSDKALAADVDHDGEVTAQDARSILRASVNLEVLHKEPAAALTSKEVYNLARAYTVEIRADVKGGYAIGSGFAYREDVVATNYHVIANAKSISVTDYKGHTYELDSILAVDRKLDIALLKLKNASFTVAELDTEDYETGDKVYTLGSSNGYTGTFADGVIANAHVEIPDFNDQLTFIQTTAPISGGNSGGPLIDERGRVIGLTEMSDTAGQNLNFAIPVAYLKKLNTSSPMNIEQFREAEANYKSLDRVFGDKEAHLRVGGASIHLYEVTSQQDYTLSVRADTDAVKVYLLEDGYYTTVVIAALRECSNAAVTVSFEGAPEADTVIPVTVDAEAPETFSQKIAPDFGAIFGAAPAAVQTTGLSFFPAFTYNASSLGTNPNADQVRAEYEKRLTELGFELSETSSSLLRTVTIYNYTNESTGVTVQYMETRSFGRLSSITINIA